MDGIGRAVGAALSAVLAVLIALQALYAPVRRRIRSADAAVDVLRGLHSGHIGDYITWLLVGVVGLAALIGVPVR